MIINNKLFVINVEDGKILHYMSISDNGADMFVISLSQTSLKILEEKFRTNVIYFQNSDKSLEIYGADGIVHLSFKRIDNSEKIQLNLNPEETLKLKTILCPSH